MYLAIFNCSISSSHYLIFMSHFFAFKHITYKKLRLLEIVVLQEAPHGGGSASTRAKPEPLTQVLLDRLGN